jgi:Ca2+-binding RTX toxin-like protein
VGEPAVVNAPNGRLTVNGNGCTSTVNGVTAPMTTNTTTKIQINGTAMADKVIIDLLPGTFGQKIFSNMGGITIDFVAASGGADVVMIRGSSNPDTFKFASAASGEIYADLTGDKTADIKIMPGAGAVALTASMGAGADTVLANPAAADLTGFAGVMNITVAELATALIAYGGAGMDRFTGGLGNDTFYGGDEDDTFNMAVMTDGADIYQGDSGSDTVNYGNRTAPLTVDVGPATPTAFGTIDLGATPALFGAGGMLDTNPILINVDSGTDVMVTFAAPVGPMDVVAQINAACTTATEPCVAGLTGKNYLKIATTSTVANMGTVEIKSVASGVDGALGLTQAVVSTTDDADDGLGGENDDVRSTTENITGGTNNDILFGDAAKNTIKGGLGDDTLEGGANTCMNLMSADGDSLQGENGDDTFYVPQANCFAVLAGGMGTNDVAIFSGRFGDVSLSNDTVANDGEGTVMEKGNIGSDIESITGGYGNDTLTGGANADSFNGGAGNDFLVGGGGDDAFVGGPGADTFNGGAGFDSVSYSTYLMAAPVTATLCVTTMTTVSAIDTACGARDDGSTENDQIANVERVVGGAGDDSMTAASTATDTTFEGGAGVDTLNGAGGNDILYGDLGDDQLFGFGGDDSLDGGGGDDRLNGGNGDGDICTNDAADVMGTRRVACELGG